MSTSEMRNIGAMVLDEQNLIEIWKKEVTNQLGWSSSSEVKQRDYEYLSQEIFAVTQVELSTTTLRRIWSNQYKSLPQVHTLNAMAAFLGEADWNSFKKKTSLSEGPAETPMARFKIPVKTLLFFTLTLTLVAILAFGLYPGSEPETPDFTVSLSSDQPRYHGVPATAGFSYDIQEATSPVDIELSWNPMERKQLDPDKNFYSGVYYYPDYHSTKLLSGDHVLAHIPVYVTTDDWHALVMKEDNDVYPTYIEKEDFIGEKGMGFGAELLTRYGLGQAEQIHSVFTFSNPKMEAYDGDSLELVVDFVSIQDKSNPPCPSMDVVLKAVNGTARIPIKGQGCYGEIRMHYGDQLVSGKEKDLSSITGDLYLQQRLHLVVANGVVTVQLGQNEPYSFKYNKQVGELKVLKFIFSGFGYVQNVELSSPRATPYSEQFIRDSVF